MAKEYKAIVKEPLFRFSATVNRCARCGGNHTAVTFVAFEIPFTDSAGLKYPFWGTCPVTGDPILMRITVGLDKPLDI